MTPLRAPHSQIRAALWSSSSFPDFDDGDGDGDVDNDGDGDNDDYQHICHQHHHHWQCQSTPVSTLTNLRCTLVIVMSCFNDGDDGKGHQYLCHHHCQG